MIAFALAASGIKQAIYKYFIERIRQQNPPAWHKLWLATVLSQLRGCLKNSAHNEDHRKLRIKIWFCEVNTQGARRSGSICRTKADF